MKTGNEIIAEYLKLKHRIDYGFDGGNELLMVRVGPPDEWVVAKYDTKIEWLYPVYIKLRTDLLEINSKDVPEWGWNNDTALSLRGAIEYALISGNIQELHKEIVEGIKFLTKQKKDIPSG